MEGLSHVAAYFLGDPLQMSFEEPGTAPKQCQCLTLSSPLNAKKLLTLYHWMMGALQDVSKPEGPITVARYHSEPYDFGVGRAKLMSYHCTLQQHAFSTTVRSWVPFQDIQSNIGL